MNRVIIKGGRVINPAAKSDEIRDLLIEDGAIVKKFAANSRVVTIDAKGLIVTPGFVDIHTHLREPGREDEETIESGARAAAAGGFTTIACMPNTDPPIDSASVVQYINEKLLRAPIEVKIIGAISKGRQGKTLAEMGEMAANGVVAFSDDGSPVSDSFLMRTAMEYTKNFNLPIISHAEEMSLSRNGVMNESFYSTVLGLKGIPSAAEEVMVARDIALAGLTGARLHLAHISTEGAVRLVRAAKQEGLNISCEVTPHHLSLTDVCLMNYNTNYKVNPPLRGESDVKALWAALADGTIDAIATDHAPHAAHEKEKEIEAAAFGLIGLETALPVIISAAEENSFKLADLIPKLTLNPARILGLNRGSLKIGSQADVVIFDHKAKVKIDPDKFESRSRNTPFAGREFKGKVVSVIKQGKVIVEDGKVVN